MGNYLLLRDARACPACHYKSLPGHFKECRVCRTLLFLRPIDFLLWEHDGGERNYWLFTSADGWKHRDYVIAQRQAAAQTRDEKISLPSPNNHTTPEAIGSRHR